MRNVHTPKNVGFGFRTYCEDCPYVELDIVEDMWECGTSTVVTCKNEDICSRVNVATRDEIGEFLKMKKAMEK